MVAASKMRKAQDRMNTARPYAKKMRNVVAHLAHANSEYHHPYMTERAVKNIGVIVVSTDRGLCGGLNANMFRLLLKQMQGWEKSGKNVKVCAIGNKAAGFFSRFGGDMVGQVTHLGDTPSINDLIGTVKIMLEMFDSGEVDEVHLVYNQFVNSMTQTPTFEQLLPVVPSGEDELRHHWDYIYEPEAKDVLDELLTRYIESLVFQGVVENTASEQSARMVAMKSASDNAGKLIDELQLIYNKARQAAITQELSEIVAGAAAV
jgi:F-type H+-transporting ATPase subunit gamma